MEFPQFRKYKNNLSYFKIHSFESFTEWKLNGTKLEEIKIEAKILPDRNYINDMLTNYEPYWDVIDEEVFSSFLKEHQH